MTVTFPTTSICLIASRGCSLGAGRWGQANAIPDKATAPQGILRTGIQPNGSEWARQNAYLMKKIHLQLAKCEMVPPSTGPRTNETASVIPTRAPKRLGLWAGPTSKSPICAKLYRPEPPMPWNTRQAILGIGEE